MGFDDLCNTGLNLELGFSSSSTTPETCTQKLKSPVLKVDQLTKVGAINFDPSLSLSLSGDKYQGLAKKVEQSADLCRQDSAASSFSNINVKREREVASEEAVETTTGRVSSRVSDEDEDGSNVRKKLRLTKAQSALLEESFKHHSTLNPKQKQELASELNLRPRQVEVWFQNRRARTKLKQTEVDCEFLKKCCERLTDENRRLQKEIQELKALKMAQPLYMQLPAATLTMCPSCERIGSGVGVGVAEDAPKTAAFKLAASKPHFYSAFTNPSAAC